MPSNFPWLPTTFLPCPVWLWSGCLRGGRDGDFGSVRGTLARSGCDHFNRFKMSWRWASVRWVKNGTTRAAACLSSGVWKRFRVACSEAAFPAELSGGPPLPANHCAIKVSMATARAAGCGIVASNPGMVLPSPPPEVEASQANERTKGSLVSAGRFWISSAALEKYSEGALTALILLSSIVNASAS